jgi:dihydrofolate reductase
MAIGGMVEWNSGKTLHRANNARLSSRSEIAKRACYPDGTRLVLLLVSTSPVAVRAGGDYWAAAERSADAREHVMRSITATMSVTLDGVVQGPGRPDEDTRGGFTHGGWGLRYNDQVMGREMAKGMAKPGDMLFGHSTWQDFITAWGRQTDGNPFTMHMNAATKYVVSRTLEDADAWQNSILLRGEAVETVAELKAQPGNDLSIIGSASLVRSLHAAGLIDIYTLLIHPLTLGSGTRLFDDSAPLTEFELTSGVTSSKGVIIAHYLRR